MKDFILSVCMDEKMEVTFENGINRLNVHQSARQFIQVKLSDFTLSEDETLHIAFEKSDGSNTSVHLNPVIMNLAKEEDVENGFEIGAYYLRLPVEVRNTTGEWKFTLYIKSNWNEETGTADSVWSSKEYTFSEFSAIEDDGISVPSETDIAALYNTAVMASKNAEANAESANASAESAAQSAAEAETIARETAETTATITAKSVAKETAEATAKETAEGVLDGKVDKITEVTGIRRVYGISQNGDQTAFDVNEDYAPESIPFRDGSGRIKVATPTEDSHAVNKGYADTNFAKLDESGKVPASQLPSYVDDVLEYATINSFPVPGESGKIYVDISTNLTYRWSGTKYTEISESLALGETSSTAYAGDKGKKNAEDIVKLQSEKLDKPILPLKPSAVVMNADGSVDTKPLLEFQEKIYDEDDNKQYTYQLKIKNGYPVLVMTEITETE